MQLIQKIGILFCVAILFFSCSEEKKVFVNTPIDQLIKKLDTKKTFSIILYDMDIDEGSGTDVYKHKYKVIISKEEKTSEANNEDASNSVFRFASNDANNNNIFRFVDNENDSTTGEDSSTSEIVEQDVTAIDVEEEIGEWVVVEKDFFEHHINNMGMEVASKDAEGKVNKVPAPPGYGTHVGNDKYGKWERKSDGTSFWVFYGQYAMMRSMFGYHSPIYRNNYSSYRSNYHGKQSYYGTKTGSTNAYGTGSANARTQNPSVANKSSSFKSKVNSIKSRSRSTTRTRSSGRSGSSGRGRSGGGGGK